MSNLLTLYEITNELDACIDYETGEVNVEALDALQGQFAQKVSSCGLVIKNLSATADAINDEMESLKARRDTLNNAKDRLKQYVLDNMVRARLPKVETSRCVLSVRKSPAKVVIDDEQKVPPVFKTEVITVKIDKVSMSKWLKDDRPIPGAHLEQGTHLVIK